MNTPEKVKEEAAGVPKSNSVGNAQEQNRSYNPIDEAKRGNVAQELNSDSARNRVGPSTNPQ